MGLYKNSIKYGFIYGAITEDTQIENSITGYLCVTNLLNTDHEISAWVESTHTTDNTLTGSTEITEATGLISASIKGYIQPPLDYEVKNEALTLECSLVGTNKDTAPLLGYLDNVVLEAHEIHSYVLREASTFLFGWIAQGHTTETPITSYSVYSQDEDTQLHSWVAEAGALTASIMGVVGRLKSTYRSVAAAVLGIEDSEVDLSASIAEFFDTESTLTASLEGYSTTTEPLLSSCAVVRTLNKSLSAEITKLAQITEPIIGAVGTTDTEYKTLSAWVEQPVLTQLITHEIFAYMESVNITSTELQGYLEAEPEPLEGYFLYVTVTT